MLNRRPRNVAEALEHLPKLAGPTMAQIDAMAPGEAKTLAHLRYAMEHPMAPLAKRAPSAADIDAMPAGAEKTLALFKDAILHPKRPK